MPERKQLLTKLRVIFLALLSTYISLPTKAKVCLNRKKKLYLKLKMLLYGVIN